MKKVFAVIGVAAFAFSAVVQAAPEIFSSLRQTQSAVADSE